VRERAAGDGAIVLGERPGRVLVEAGEEELARELLLAVLACRIADPKLRDEASRSAKSACLNCAEGAGRVSRADKARAFAIARAEAVEAAAAVEIAALCGDVAAGPAREVARLADRLVALLTGLVRWRA